MGLQRRPPPTRQRSQGTPNTPPNTLPDTLNPNLPKTLQKGSQKGGSPPSGGRPKAAHPFWRVFGGFGLRVSDGVREGPRRVFGISPGNQTWRGRDVVTQAPSPTPPPGGSLAGDLGWERGGSFPDRHRVWLQTSPNQARSVSYRKAASLAVFKAPGAQPYSALSKWLS